MTYNKNKLESEYDTETRSYHVIMPAELMEEFANQVIEELGNSFIDPTDLFD